MQVFIFSADHLQVDLGVQVVFFEPSCILQLAHCKLQVTNWRLQTAGCKLHAADLQTCRLARLQSCNYLWKHNLGTTDGRRDRWISWAAVAARKYLKIKGKKAEVKEIPSRKNSKKPYKITRQNPHILGESYFRSKFNFWKKIRNLWAQYVHPWVYHITLYRIHGCMKFTFAIRVQAKIRK